MINTVWYLVCPNQQQQSHGLLNGLVGDCRSFQRLDLPSLLKIVKSLCHSLWCHSRLCINDNRSLPLQLLASIITKSAQMTCCLEICQYHKVKVLTKTAEEAGPRLVNTARILSVLLLHVLQVCAACPIKERILELAHRHWLGSPLLGIRSTALEQAIAVQDCRAATQLISYAACCHTHCHCDNARQQAAALRDGIGEDKPKCPKCPKRRALNLPSLACYVISMRMSICVNQSWTRLQNLSGVPDILTSNSVATLKWRVQQYCNMGLRC